jgi:hypothetical protein
MGNASILPCKLCNQMFDDSYLIGKKEPDIYCEDCFKQLLNCWNDSDDMLRQLTDCIKKLDLFRNIEINKDTTLVCNNCSKMFIDFTKIEDKRNLTGGMCWSCLRKSNEDYLNKSERS